MKIFIQLFLISILVFGLESCSLTKQETYQLQKEAPFKIGTATYQEWIAGVRGGGSGISVVIIIDEESASKIEFDSLFFRDQKVKLTKSNSKLIAHLKTKINNRDDIILHESPQEEYGNRPPENEDNIPFDLTAKEAIISYKEKNQTKFVKILLTQIQSPLYQ